MHEEEEKKRENEEHGIPDAEHNPYTDFSDV